MSTAKDEFELPAPIEAASEAVRKALLADSWSIEDDAGTSFMARQRYGFVTIMWQRRANAAIFLRPAGPHATAVELNTELFGFGPYPRWRLRRTMDRLKEVMFAALNSASPRSS